MDDSDGQSFNHLTLSSGQVALAIKVFTKKGIMDNASGTYNSVSLITQMIISWDCGARQMVLADLGDLDES